MFLKGLYPELLLSKILFEMTDAIQKQNVFEYCGVMLCRRNWINNINSFHKFRRFVRQSSVVSGNIFYRFVKVKRIL